MNSVTESLQRVPTPNAPTLVEVWPGAPLMITWVDHTQGTARHEVVITDPEQPASVAGQTAAVVQVAEARPGIAAVVVHGLTIGKKYRACVYAFAVITEAQLQRFGPVMSEPSNIVDFMPLG
jgi:hypothetical protein